MLAGFVGLCLLVGLSAASVTSHGRAGWYDTLQKPWGTPPAWVFGPVWTTLYLMMAVAAWTVWRQAGIARRRHYRALRLWGWQLLANACWSPAFFGLHAPGLAFAVIVVLAVLVGATLQAFRRIDRGAAALMAPYAAWVLYAGWLTAGTWWLNALAA